MSNVTDIKDALSMDNGWGADSTATSNLKQDMLQVWVESGFRQVYSPPIMPGQKIAHEWSFLKPRFLIDTNAPYSTGTVAIAAGVVTLSAGTFPSWAANGDLIVGGKTYEVASRGGNTAVTLIDTSVTVTAGATYNLVCPRYDLPAGFAGMLGPLVYRPGESVINRQLEFIGEFQIANKRSLIDTVNRPLCFGIQNMGSATFKLLLYPVPDAVYGFLGRARINPGTNLVGGDDYFELFLESCLAVAESRSIDNAGIHAAKFKEMLSAAISLDQSQFVPEFGGIDHDRSERERDPYYGYPAYSSGDIGTYTGHTISGA